MHLQLGEVSHIVISSPEAAKQVMKTHDISFAQRPFLLSANIVMYNFKDVAFAPYGDSWRQLRKICTLELLSMKRVQSFRSIREDEISNLIRSISICKGSPVNLSEMIFSISNAITLRSAFGTIWKHQDGFLPLVQKIILLLDGFSIADVFPSAKLLHRISGMRRKLEKLHQEADVMLENILNEHREKKGLGKSDSNGNEYDLVDVLLNLQDHGDLEFPLTTDSIKAVMLNIFLAGSETSSTTVEWAMSEMLKDSRVMEKAQAELRQVFNKKENIDETSLHELKYLKSVIKETLRLHPAAPLIPRECRETVEINGYDVPINTKVIINAWAIGRDPRYWIDAERFYPERFLNNSIDFKGKNFEFIPFGAGRRMCPGIAYGIAVVELALANLLYHFDWELPNEGQPYQIDMSESFGLSARRKNDLYLIPIPHQSNKLFM